MRRSTGGVKANCQRSRRQRRRSVKRLIRDGILALPVQLDHALAVADLPDFHRDTFDRMLVAQARCERMTFVTADEAIFRYDVEILRA